MTGTPSAGPSPEPPLSGSSSSEPPLSGSLSPEPPLSGSSSPEPPLSGSSSPEPPTPALHVDVGRSIGEFRLDVEVTIDRGLAAIVGPSGSGKSTTLALVAGLLRPERGTVAIAGEVVADARSGLHVRTQDRRVGMVFQDASLLPHRDARDNVALAVRAGDRRSRRSVADAWLDRVGATELARRHPRELSGGQRQRVALARALAGEPRLLLLDEPLSALDLAVRLELRALVREVVDAAGVPALFVTHDEAEADELADVVVRYDSGRVVSTQRRSRASTRAADDVGET